ncbi:50S ribosomal protein L7/L12-serine acetyltransferase [Kosakonia oryzae]|uniref:50S ribosomal protein L7/L12-serine acetyltransferase n=1 Tax=Kosakonia oryzae TaxID=497725 RepID=A0AA94H3G9_9ENTR|nr:50S ribosomal protein L7/L12-serine acetyltransferase [Kosakonia oryzae]ANI82897.1 50S ribosomal protein L7/L12-serine acetyltransferase [Kosakonia oryzae]SFC16754.1 ribosomal-protein-serine acetyltransferase [Kosakonia oryzae]
MATEHHSDTTIPVNDHITLQAADERFVHDLYQLIVKNRDYLQQFLDWPQYVRTVDDTRKTLQSNMLLHQRGYAKTFMIVVDEVVTGVLAFNTIEPLNKTAYIGYWLDKEAQGQGILSQALQALMAFYARRGDVRRFVIKCRVANHASNQVAKRNGFTLEGCLKQAEFLNGHYDDQNIWAKVVTHDQSA